MHRAAYSLAALLALPVHAQTEPVLLATESAAILPISGEVRVEIEGVQGAIGVRVGKPGELRFLSRKPGGRNAEEIPLAVWSDGATVRLTPPEGEAAQERDLEASVPPGLYVRILANDSKVVASSLQGGLEVAGRALVVQAGGIEGDVEIDVEGGSVSLQGIGGSAVVRGSEVQAQIGGVRGSLLLTATGQKTLGVRDVGSGVDADLDGARLEVAGVKGPFRLRARGGSVALSALEQGGDLELTGAALRVEKSKGAITVNTDQACEFVENEASLHVDAYGPSALVRQNKGIVEVRARNAEVVLEKIEGAARVEGDGLRLRADDIGGEFVAILGLSEAFVQNVGGKTVFETERGDLELRRATQLVEIKSEGGSVRLLDLNGPVLVDADGALVEVTWVSTPATEDSSILNEGGDVIVRFPPGGGARVEASASYGRIESSIDTVRLFDGDTRAEGVVNRRQRPTVRIESGGDVQILGGE